MVKEVKIYKDRCKYETTKQTETYRQQDQKEKKILAAKTKADIEKLEPYFSVNNNYLALYKKNPENKNLDSLKFEHPMDRIGNDDYDYCQKCSRDKKFCPHKNKERLDTLKEELKVPIINSQDYGWRQPIDTTTFGYGLKSTMQIFSNTFRNSEKAKPAEKK